MMYLTPDLNQAVNLLKYSKIFVKKNTFTEKWDVIAQESLLAPDAQVTLFSSDTKDGAKDFLKNLCNTAEYRLLLNQLVNTFTFNRFNPDFNTRANPGKLEDIFGNSLTNVIKRNNEQE